MYKSQWFSWVVIFGVILGCHDVLILGISPIKWRQRPDMTIAVGWDAKHQLKQTNFGAKENCQMNLNGLSKTHEGSGPSTAYLKIIYRNAVMGSFIPD